MNPLSRKMFRDPMSSRKPAGILASSAPMMTAAQKAMAKNQPMKAQTGASVNTSNYMSAIAQLTQQGDVQTLTNILQDTRLPTGVRTAARDAIGSLQPKPRNVAPQVRPQVGPPMADIPSIQGPPAVAVPGYPVGTDSAVLAGLTDDQLAARMSAEANVLNATQSKPQTASSQVGPSMAGIPSIQGPPAVAVPGYSVGEDGAITSPLTDDQLAARMSAEMEARLKNDVGPQNIFTGTDPYDSSVYGMGDESSGLTITGQEPTPESVAFGVPALIASMRGNVRTDPTTSMIAAGQSPQGRPFGVTDTPGLDILGVFKGDEQAKDIEPDITDMGVGADTEDAATTTATTAAATDVKPIDTSEIDNMLKRAQAGTLVEGEINLSAEEASTPEAAAVAALAIPKNVSLSKMQERAKDIMGFDPAKADKAKKDAFWMNLMTAGLAMAAGESDNALTNVAKGLLVGVDSYSKDIARLTDQDREDQREYRATVRDLVKSEEDKNIALAASENAYNMQLAQLNQNRDQFKTKMDFDRAAQKIQMNQFNTNAAIQLSQITTDLQYKNESLRLQGKELDQSAIRTELMYGLGSNEIMQNGLAFGYTAYDESGALQYTPKGIEWRDNAIENGLADVLMLTGGKTSSSGTDTDTYAKSLQTQYGISLAEAVILANNQKQIDDIGIAQVAKDLNITLRPPGSAGGFTVKNN